MKRAFLYLFLSVFTLGIVFADVQVGYVRTIKRPGKKAEYLSNAEISVKGIPGSFRSKDKGRFELELRPLNLKVGNTFTLSSVFKSGYELYDNNLQRVYSPGVPVEIVLRNLAQEAEEQTAFANNMFKGSEKKYKRKISELEKQVREGRISEAEYRRQLQEYQALFDRYQAQINVIAKRYAGLDYENIDPATEAINVAFSQGDYELADSLLNALGSVDARAAANIAARKDIEAKINFGSSLIEEGNSERRQNLEDAEKIAELLYAKHLSFLNDFRNDSAAYYLRRRAELLPDNAQYQLEAGKFITYYLADYSEALDYFNKACSLFIEQYDETYFGIATVYNNIGTIYDIQNNYVRALDYYEKALKIQMETFGVPHSDIAVSYNNIGGAYFRRGIYDLALENYKKSLKMFLEIFDDNYPAVALSYNNIGEVYYAQTDYVHALEYYKKGLKILLELFNELYPDVATIYNNIGLIHSIQGDYASALEYYEEALNIWLIIFGDKYPSVATVYNNIGLAYSSQENYIDALEYCRKALSIRLSIFNDKHRDVANSYNNIGLVYFNHREYIRALEYYEKALNIQLEVLNDSHPDIATIYSNMGSVYYFQGDYASAEKYYEKALTIWLKLFGENHYYVIALRDLIEQAKEKMKE